MALPTAEPRKDGRSIPFADLGMGRDTHGDHSALPETRDSILEPPGSSLVGRTSGPCGLIAKHPTVPLRGDKGG